MIILSLFDYSGNWSKPYRENGFEVIQIDIKLGIDILLWDYKTISRTEVFGILAAIPCTDFALSGRKYFATKDQDGRTEKSIRLVHKTLEIIKYFNPHFWVVENPMSRIHSLVPELGEVKYKFNPCDFARYEPTRHKHKSRYNKTTWLWGKFNAPKKKPLRTLMSGYEWKDSQGGSGEKRKENRSITPKGFAYAFYFANCRKGADEMNIGYARVSSKDQNEVRQIEALKTITDKIFVDKVSGKDLNRPELQKVLEFAREGDTITVESISRFARNTKDLLELIEILRQKKVEFKSIKEAIDTTTATGKFMITIFGAVAELERDYIRQRQREGIDIALEEGREIGRPQSLSEEQIKEAYRKFINPSRISPTKKIYEDLGISKATFYRLMKEEELRFQSSSI